MLWYFHRFSVFAWTGKNDSITLRSGGSRRGSLFLDQAEARSAEKKFSVTPFPISPPHPTPTRLPLSKDLNPALLRVDAFFFFGKLRKKSIKNEKSKYPHTRGRGRIENTVRSHFLL